MKKLLGVAALLVAAAVLVPVALAAPVNLGSETLLGGGPGGSEWDVQNEGGTSNGLPAGGDDDSSPGLNVHDAVFTGGQTDAFDHGLMVFVDDVIFAAPGGDADLTGETLTAGPVTLSDLDVTMQYFALSSEAKLRTFVTFENPSGSPIAATVSWVTNMGSDDDTAVAGTSSGDALFTTADRWVVTFEDCCDPLDNDPVNTHVLFGPGSPAVTPSSVSQTVFDNSGTEGILAEYDITVPAGETRYLLFFNQLSETNGDALTDAAAQFDANPPPTSELLSDLTEDQLLLVLNWDFLPLLPELQCLKNYNDVQDICVSLDPKTGSNTVGDEHTVTASLSLFENGVPNDPLVGQLEGISLFIFVIKGPNAGERIIAETDSEGKLALVYTGDGGVGKDQIGTEVCLGEGGCTFGVDAFIDGCVQDPDPCVFTFFEHPTCEGSVDDQFLCDFAEKDWTGAVLAATPTPTPTPTPTAVAVVVQLPTTGGTPSDGGPGALPWLAAVAGAIALIGSGSAWFAYQRRRIR